MSTEHSGGTPQPMERCDDCSGSGVHGGPGGYYDTPGKGKPCGTCHGTGRVRRQVDG